MFSLPHHHTESTSVGWNNPSYDGAGGAGGGGWAGCHEDNSNREGQKRWGDGEEDVAVLRAEVRASTVS